MPETFKYLTERCGHHCGAIAVIGSKHVTVGHCGCPECHHGAGYTEQGWSVNGSPE